jgi:hypothetical protein
MGLEGVLLLILVLELEKGNIILRGVDDFPSIYFK